MKKDRSNKKLLKYLESTLEDSKFDLKKLLDDHFFNFSFEDNYGFEFSPNKGLIRKRIVQLLFQIHDNWKIELEKLNKPYYLAIWMYEPNIIYSDVVCAIDERIDMYSKDWFDASNKPNLLRKESYGTNQKLFHGFDWERKILYQIHESYEYETPKEGYRNLKQYYKYQRFYRKILPKCKKVKEDKYGKIYYQEIGDIWVGIKTQGGK